MQQVPGDDRPVPSEERHLLVKPRRVDEPVPELFGRLLRLAPMVGEGFVVRVERGGHVELGVELVDAMPAGTSGAGRTPAKSTRISWKRRISW